MTSIQRPGGPTGPSAPTGTDASAGPGEAGAVATSSSGAAGTDRAAELAAAVDAGALPPEQAIAQLIDDAVAGLPPEEAAELRALMADFLGADPYLADLGRELGVPADPGGGAE